MDRVPYLMTGPTPAHQQILLVLAAIFHAIFLNRHCTPYIVSPNLTFEQSLSKGWGERVLGCRSVGKKSMCTCIKMVDFH